MFRASAALSIVSCAAFMMAGIMIVRGLKRQLDIENALTWLLLCGAWTLVGSAVAGFLGFIGV